MRHSDSGSPETPPDPEDPAATLEITRLLRLHHGGDRAAFDEMIPGVYAHLRRIATGQLRRSTKRDETLSATVLVQEAYIKLARENNIDWQDRAHFFATCALVMRHIVVDYARQRLAQKRGGDVVEVTLRPDMVAIESQLDEIVAVHDAVDGLAQFNPRLAKVVECRYFGGMTEEETAAALDTSLRTVQRDWERARAWLSKSLRDR